MIGGGTVAVFVLGMAAGVLFTIVLGAAAAIASNGGASPRASPTFECEACGKSFVSYDDAIDHGLSAHKAPNASYAADLVIEP